MIRIAKVIDRDWIIIDGTVCGSFTPFDKTIRGTIFHSTFVIQPKDHHSFIYDRVFIFRLEKYPYGFVVKEVIYNGT